MYSPDDVRYIYAWRAPLHRRVYMWIRYTFLLWAADRLPWFLRKAAVNTVCGVNVYHDFIATDHVQRGAFHLMQCSFKW